MKLDRPPGKAVRSHIRDVQEVRLVPVALWREVMRPAGVAHDARVAGSDPNSTLGAGVLSVAPEAFHMGRSVDPSSRRGDGNAEHARVSASDEETKEKRWWLVACDGLVGDIGPNNTVWADGP